jgi:hypothetical protein
MPERQPRHGGRGKKEKFMGPIKWELSEHFSGTLVSKSQFSLLRSLYFCFTIKTFSFLLLSGLLSFNSLRDRGKTDLPHLLGGIILAPNMELQLWVSWSSSQGRYKSSWTGWGGVHGSDHNHLAFLWTFLLGNPLATLSTVDLPS